MLRRTLSIALSLPLLATFLVATPAAASDSIPLAGSGRPAVLLTTDRLDIAAIVDGAAVDPAALHFVAHAGTPVETTLTAAIADGLSAPADGDIAVQHGSGTGPEDDRVSLAIATPSGVSPWDAGVDRVADVSEATSLVWNFPAAGTYTVDFTVSRASVPGVTATATYTIDVTSAPPAVPIGADPTADSRVTATPAASAAPAVVSAGDLRITTGLDDDGELTRGLTLTDDSGTSTDLDIANTVIRLPTGEDWPGAAEDATLWNTVSPTHGQIWRSRADEVGANPVTVSLDVSTLDPSALMTGTAWSALGDTEGEGSASWLFHGVERVPPARSADPTAWIAQSADTNPTTPMAFVFDGTGRQCVTVQTMAKRASDGAVLNHDITLTFAVGDVDPATITPCPQPDPIPTVSSTPVPATDQGTVVIGSGSVNLASLLNGDSLSLALVSLDRGRPTSYDPAHVVLAVPTRDTRWPGLHGNDHLWKRVAPVGTTLWRTSGAGARDKKERSNALLFGVTGAYTDASSWDQSTEEWGTPRYRLRGASVPDGGSMVSYVANVDGSIDYPADIGAWSTRSSDLNAGVPGASVSGPDMWPPYPAIDPSGTDGILGLAFSAPGVYCLAVEATGTLASTTSVAALTTLTVAVGVDATQVTPCAQPPLNLTVNSPETQPDHRDPSVSWYEKGHLDLRPIVGDDGEFRLATKADDEEPTSLDDTVWLARGEYTRFAVPTPDEYQDLTFIGPPGTPYYGFFGSPIFQNYALWPGISTMSLPREYYDRVFTWTVSSVTGPGELYVYGGASRADTANAYFDSENLPASFTIGRSHVHQSWSFTQPGVYCIDVTVAGRKLDATQDVVASGLLTVAVGDIDLAGVEPCGRSATSTGPRAETFAAASASKTVVDRKGSRLDLSVSAEGLGAGISVPGDVGEPRTVVDPERAVISVEPSGDVYNQRWFWSATAIPRGALDGDIDMRLGTVTGPGDYYVADTRIGGFSTPTLDTRAGQVKTQETLFAGRIIRGIEYFTAPGVYCVPYTWSATRAGGGSLSITKVLTFAVGVADPGSVALCTDGGGGDSGTDPDPGTGSGTDVRWDVPNLTPTQSGALILTDGHIDVASRVENGALVTSVKDDTSSAGAVLRRPQDVVVQIRPEAQTQVPSQSAFSFLGAAGSSIWQVDQVQRDGLIWPGWSTELIDQGAVRGDVTWKLRDMRGPGEFALYETVLGSPHVLFSTRDGITAADSFAIPHPVHAHGNWAFSAEGVYCLDFERSATMSTGATSRSDFVLAVAVGRTDVTRVDPSRCFTADPGQPTAQDSTPVSDDRLASAARGDVAPVTPDETMTPGQLVTIQVGRQHAGRWVSLWLHSTPTWLGWKQVGASGAVQVRLPADAPVGSHRLVVKAASGALIGWTPLTLTASPSTTGVDPAPASATGPAAVSLAATQCVAGATVLSSGHIDYASRIVGGRLRSLVGDDSSGTKVYREPDGVILWVKPTSRLQLPGGFGRVGAAGATVWQIPQTQNPSLVWLGWSTEALNSATASGPVTWTLDSVDGPGDVTVYTSGAFGGVQDVVLSGSGSRTNVPLGVHAHANWAFSEQGVYRLRMTQSVNLAGGGTSSDTQTLTLAVGDVDPATALGASGSGCDPVSATALADATTQLTTLSAPQSDAAAAADAARTRVPGDGAGAGVEAAPFSTVLGPSPVPLLLMILGGLLLAGAIVGGTLWRTRRRAAPPCA